MLRSTCRTLFFFYTPFTFCFFNPCVACLVLVPLYAILLVFTVSILSLVVAAKALPRVIRFVLVNILIANFTAGFGMLGLEITLVIVTTVQHFSQTEELCKFAIAFISVGCTSRPLIMGVYAVVVCIIIKKSISAVMFKFLFICLLAMWLVCVAFSLTIFSPSVMQVLTLCPSLWSLWSSLHCSTVTCTS